MSYRSFTDSTGTEWEAFDVVPQLAERRVGDRRHDRKPIGFVDRRGSERRAIKSHRAVMAPGLGGGWLCFESDSDKRRLSPIPPGWAQSSDAEIEDYCRLAHPVRRSAQSDGRRRSA